MKLRYFAAFLSVVAVFCLFAYAGADSLKNDFFKAESFFDADGVTLFDSLLQKDGVLKFVISEKSSDGKLDYNVYYDGGDDFFIESPDNFDFTIASGKSCDELLLPYTVMSLFADSAKWHKDYSDLTDGFCNILKNNVSESDFSSSTTYVKRDGVRKRCDGITLELRNNTRIIADFKAFFASSEFAEMIDRVYGFEYTPTRLAEYVDRVVTAEKISLVYRRNISVGKAFEESISINTGNNIYSVSVTSDTADGRRSSSVTATDMNKTLDFKLNFERTDDLQRLDITFNDEHISAVEQNGSALVEIKDAETEKKIEISTAEGYSSAQTVYDMRVPSEKRLIFTRLSDRITGNADAALLFRTYEVNLKPLNVNTKDLKINFDE